MNDFPDTALTVTYWMKSPGVTTDGSFFSYATLSEDNQFLIYNYNNFQIYLNGFYSPNTGISAVDGLWHHIAFTWKSSDGKINLYKDGNLVYSDILAQGTSIPDSGGLVFGQDQDSVGGGFQSHQSYYGSADEVSVWNIAKTTQEIREMMHLTLNGNEPGLVSYWQFNETAGDTAYDVVGNNDAAVFKGTGNARINSTVPVGGGSSYTNIVTTTGTFDFTGTKLSMDFTAKTGGDTILVTKIDLGPNTYPSITLADTFNSQYWVVTKFGSGSFTADLTFNPNETITSEDETSPDALWLFNRVSNSDSSWSNIMEASEANASNNTVTFDSLTFFSQFLIGKQWFTDISAGLTGMYYSSAAWGDYDNDGDPDILLTGEDAWGNPTSTIYRNDLSTDGTERVFTDINAGLTGVHDGSAAWGDYDNNGDLDILLAGYAWSLLTSRIYCNDSGVFTDINAGLAGVGYSSVAWGDYDNDGDLDILLTGITNSAFSSRIYRNDLSADGTERVFTDINAGLTGVQDGSVAWGDYDNDGDLDILLTGHSGSSLISLIYRNDPSTGSGTERVFTDVNAGLTVVGYSSAAWGDYDNDGDLDILLTGASSSALSSQIYRNDSGVFTGINAGFPGVYRGSVAWGDYDNDGDLDILLTGHTGVSRIMRIYRNNNAASNTVPSSPNGLNAVISGDSLNFSWNKAGDNETPQDGLSYNLVIGDYENGFLLKSPMSDTTGYRLIPAFGNACQVTTWTYKISDLYFLPQVMTPDYWGVQAIDHAFAGSSFAMVNLDVPINYLITINDSIMNFQDTLKWEILHKDSIENYELQIDEDSLFTSCEVNETLFVALADSDFYNVHLQYLPGTHNLVPGIKYFWRIKPNYTFGLPTVFTKPAPSFWFEFISDIEDEQEVEIPKKFVLYQNYPNPFNPITTIKYALPKVSDVKIELFDMLGRKIKTLIKTNQNAGFHTFEFNADNLSSGVYIYRIQAGQFTAKKKLLLMK